MLCADDCGASRCERLRELAAKNIDWEYLFLLARRHAVVPLALSSTGTARLGSRSSRDTSHKLKQHYLENSARNTVLTAELCRLIDLFADSGIEAIPYKGPVLRSLRVRQSGAASLRRSRRNRKEGGRAEGERDSFG